MNQNLKEIKKLIQKINPKELGLNIKNLSLKKIKIKYLNKSKHHHTYLFNVGKKKFVLKKCRDGKKIRIFDSYLNVYTILKQYKINIPKVYYCPPNREFAIFEWVEGKELSEFLKKGVSKKKLLTILDRCAKSLAKLHSKSIVITPNELRRDFFRIIPFNDPRVKDSIKKYKEIIQFLPHIKNNITFSIIHGDIHPKNFIITKKDAKLIDWCKFLYGDPAFDLSRFLISSKLTKEHEKYFIKKYTKYFKKFNGFNILNLEKRIKFYENFNRDSLINNKLQLDLAIVLHRILYYLFFEKNRSAGYIQITRRCNRKCAFCSSPYIKKDLSLNEIKKQINKYLKGGVTEIIFTGGEPTLHKDLPKMISYCHKKRIPCKIITNAQKLANKEYVKILKNAGLNHVIISICSHKKEIEEKLTRKKGSYTKTLKGIENALKYIGTVNINITLTSLNQGHLFETVKFLVTRFPKIQHFVFNNLDPIGRVLDNLNLIPKLSELELNLEKTLNYLTGMKKTFRVERVPLCYMQGFEEYSTETRKIVKNEAYMGLFLHKSELEMRKIKNFFSIKDEKCSSCFLNEICAGLNPKYAELFGTEELYPVFKAKDKIIKKIII